MNEKERQDWIVNFVNNSDKAVSSKHLSEKLNVSVVTIRKDLDILEFDGKLERFHGGAIKNKKVEHHISEFSNKDKEKIAKKAVNLVQDRTTIVIGSGRTTATFAKFLSESKKKELTILTNNIIALQYLILNDNFNIIIIGGKFQKSNYSITSPMLNEMIKNMTIDQMFSGADGYNDKMITSKNDGVSFSFEVSNYAKETILLAERYKEGKSFLIPVMERSKVSKIINED